MPRVVVDASVATKWFFREAASDAALALRNLDVDLIAPELIVAEIGSAAWRKHMRNEIDTNDALFAIQTAPSLFSQLVPATALVTATMRLALDLREPIYDCFYLALAQIDRSPLVTDDEGMIAAGRKAGIETRRL